MAKYVDYNRDAEHDIINETPDYISQLSDGSNVYTIKDATARTELSGKQDILVSGTNIKTINNTSILGSGNIEVGGGSSYTAGDGIDITNNIISVDGVQTNELSIDTTPTQNSSNLITSGGVYDVLGDIETLINAL